MKEKFGNFEFFIVCVTVIFAAISVTLAFTGTSWVPSLLADSISAAFVALMCTGLVIAFLQTLRKLPKPLKIALLGPPKAGKTVYLTMLFRDLPSFTNVNMSFMPGDLSTIKTVDDNYAILQNGGSLESTPKDSKFCFRADAVLGKNLLKRRFSLEIRDVAGEIIRETDKLSRDFLPHTDYFIKYATKCEIIFLVVDLAVLNSRLHTEITLMENQLSSALLALIADKKLSAGDKLPTPVGILFFKSDLLKQKNSINEAQALQMMDRLLKTCQSKCHYSESFFVSARGASDDFIIKNPNAIFNPSNIVDPLVWALKNI